MDAQEFIENKAKSEWGLRLILEKISENQKPVLYRLMELYAQEQVKNCSIPDVVGRSEQLIAFSKWKEEKGYNPIYDHKSLVEEYLKSN